MQVLPQDVDSQYGIAHSPIGPSPSQSPLAFRPFGAAAAGPLSAYSSALARSASASGSGTLSKLSRSTSNNTSNANISHAAGGTGTSQQDAHTHDHVATPSPKGSQQPVGLGPLQEEGSSVRSVGSTASLTNAQDSTAPAQQSAQPSSTLLSPESANSSMPELTPPSHQSSRPEQVMTDDSADAGQVSQDQQAAATDASEDQPELADLAAATEANQAADAAQGPAVSETQLQQSRNAVLSGEDQAMKESLVAANAAAGETVGDELPSSSSGLHANDADPARSSSASSAVSATPSGQQQAGNAACAELVDSAPFSGQADVASTGTAAQASGVQAQAEAPGPKQGRADEDALDGPTGVQAGHIAARFRSAFIA